MNPPQLNPETEALLQGYLEGTLTSEDSTHLLASLKSQPELIGVLLEGLRMDALIREVVARKAEAKTGAGETLPPRNSLHEPGSGTGVSPVRTGTHRRDACATTAALRRQLRLEWNRPVILALAASIILLLGLTVWFFGPKMGQPVLAEVKGADISIERGTELVPAANGMALQSADVLRVGKNASATIVFGVEQTRLELSAGTELKLTSLTRGKRLVLQAGRIEVSVAHQQPFRPTIIRTPQAEARVLGTKFSLLTTANATRLDVTEGKVRLTRVSDGAAVKVPAGYYAVAANGTELAALPQTGGVLCEWWTGVKGKTRFSLSDDPRFPDRPTGRDRVPDFELKIAETNQFAVRLCGYVHPTVTGDYKFWLERPPADFAAVGFANLLMSPTENPSEVVQIAQTSGGGSVISPYVTVGTIAATLPIPLVAGKRYYLEARLVIGRGAGELSVAWQPPGQSREVLQSKFLSPWKPK